MPDILIRDTDPDDFREQITEAIRAELRALLPDVYGPRLVDRAKMAELACVSMATLDNMVRDKQIPSVTVGRRRLFQPQSVIDAMAGNA